MKLFVCDGEASGDAYAAALVREMRRLCLEEGRPLETIGVGGKRLRDVGVELMADSSRWGAVSVLESLKVVPRVMGGYYRAKRYLRNGGPGLFVPVDFGYVNIRLSRHAKQAGWTVLYFAPPGSWRRDKQGADLPHIADAISTQFSWSADLLNAAGAKAHWFGHPIRQLLRERGVGSAPRTSERIAVLPGSRAHEIGHNLPLLAATLREPAEFALASSVDVEGFKTAWARLCPARTEDLFTQGDVYGVLTRCRAAVVCSGTATLEAALCRCPMVVIYKLPKLAEFEAKLIRFQLTFAALPNILLQRMAVPELIQEQASPVNLRRELDKILNDATAREAQFAAFDELDAMLGPDDAITQTAKLALTLDDHPRPVPPLPSHNSR